LKKYVVGIDLGTTNTALAAARVDDAAARVEIFPVLQLVRSGEVRPRALLPSAIYLPAGPEIRKRALALPWGEFDHAVGQFAREQGGRVPERLVASAKSWLCHPGVDRRAAILPFGAGADVAKISPVRAQELILRHVLAAWDHAHEDAPLAEQETLLCVPASFDAAARDLTLEAARAAGLSNVTLLEEPQAAFYAWLYRQGERWRKLLAKGDVILVCDVGGGTTDFSLIEVAEREGELVLERIAVGEHLLLGGDNMDLALAHVLAWRLEGNLDAWHSRALSHACRAAKEELFEKPSKEKVAVVVGGRGTKLVGEQVKGELTQEDLSTLIVEGFFPECAVTDRPAAKKRTALVEMGLPFVADPAITRHLAAFLSRHGRHGGFARPKFVLFNGGVMKAAPLRERVVSLLSNWTGAPVADLGGGDFDLAVAEGAAYYGLVRRGRGIRIRGGSARSYYVGIEAALPAVPGMAPPVKALCVVPFGIEEGSEVAIPDREFGLLTGETAEFRFFGSTSRKQDRPGDLFERVPDEVEELAPIETAIGEGNGARVVPVTLKARLTEIGTLDLFCVEKGGGGREWKLVYNVRETQG
jgi:hypothetical protein